MTEINSYMPELVQYCHDGYFETIVIVAAKNYILYDGKKVKIKGSGLLGSMKEPALKEFLKKVIDCLVFNKQDKISDVYNDYVKEIYNLTDIFRWSSKKTLTDAVLNPKRTTEQNIANAIEGQELQEGDKFHVFFCKDKSLKTPENWNNDHDTTKLLGKLFDTLSIFSTVINIKEFPNYKLVKNLNPGREIAGLAPIIKEKKPKKAKEVNENI